jgi:hypothetical protein
MNTAELISTDADTTGSYVSVAGWKTLTLQVLSTDSEHPFAGTVTIEGTMSTETNTGDWTAVLPITSDGCVPLADQAYAGLRATTSGMSGGNVKVTVGGL